MVQITDLIQITPDPSASGGGRLELKRPMGRWPESVREDFGPDATFVLDQQSRKRAIPPNQTSILCAEISRCQFKARPGEKRDCSYNCVGLCAEAMLIENDGVCLDYDEVGNILGFSKQRAQQIQQQSMLELRRRSLTDPALSEFCKSLNLRGAPTPEEVVGEFEQ